MAATIPMLHMQAAFAISILGIYIGWRGVIAKMTGFYDLTGAVKYLLFGIVSGVLLALAVDQLILLTILDESTTSGIAVPLGTLFTLSLLISILESSFTLFLLGRPSVLPIRASPPFGWALGLGIGSMQSAYLIVRLFDPELSQLSSIAGFNVLSVFLALIISILSSIGHALPSSWQGYRLLEGERIRPIVYSSFARSLVCLTLVLSLFNPLFVLLVAPFAVLFWFSAQERWLPSGLTPAARQAYRRTIRQAGINRDRAEVRIRGQAVESEE